LQRSETVPVGHLQVQYYGIRFAPVAKLLDSFQAAADRLYPVTIEFEHETEIAEHFGGIIYYKNCTFAFNLASQHRMKLRFTFSGNNDDFPGEMYELLRQLPRTDRKMSRIALRDSAKHRTRDGANSADPDGAKSDFAAVYVPGAFRVNRIYAALSTGFSKTCIPSTGRRHNYCAIPQLRALLFPEHAECVLFFEPADQEAAHGSGKHL
jgi:hypothetical protein